MRCHKLFKPFRVLIGIIHDSNRYVSRAQIIPLFSEIKRCRPIVLTKLDCTRLLGQSALLWLADTNYFQPLC